MASETAMRAAVKLHESDMLLVTIGPVADVIAAELAPVLAAKDAEIQRLRNELSLLPLAERLNAALEAKHLAEREAQKANEYVSVFRADMERLSSEIARLERDNAELRSIISRAIPKPDDIPELERRGLAWS